MIIGFLTLCLTVTLFISATTSPATTSLPEPYDPWCDINDDGVIDIEDIVNLAIRFGSKGTPINKTALLLELQSRIDSLNASLNELNTTIVSVMRRVNALANRTSGSLPIERQSIAIGEPLKNLGSYLNITSGKGKLLIILSGDIYGSPGSDIYLWGGFRILLDGASVTHMPIIPLEPEVLHYDPDYSQPIEMPISIIRLVNVEAGSHIIQAQWYIEAGGSMSFWGHLIVYEIGE